MAIVKSITRMDKHIKVITDKISEMAEVDNMDQMVNSCLMRIGNKEYV